MKEHEGGGKRRCENTEDRHAGTRGRVWDRCASQRVKRATFHGFSNKSAACGVYVRSTIADSLSLSLSLHSFDFDFPQTTPSDSCSVIRMGLGSRIEKNAEE